MRIVFLKFALYVLVLSLIWAQPAQAGYIDPNTGGMLFQILAVVFSVLSGIILIFSGRIKKIVFRIIRLFNGAKEEQQSNEEEYKG